MEAGNSTVSRLFSDPLDILTAVKVIFSQYKYNIAQVNIQRQSYDQYLIWVNTIPLLYTIWENPI